MPKRTPFPRRSRRGVVIGLTGGIASGKSTVLREFARLGAKTLDSDRIARQAVRPGLPALRRIARRFGRGVIEGGRLNRAKLAEIVFSNPAKRKQLEAIVHPEVIRVLKREIAKERGRVVVADIPLLFEAALRPLVDRVVVVWTPLSAQIRRLMKERGCARTEALRRIRAQWPLTRKRKLADEVIDNSASRARAKAQVVRLYRELRKGGFRS